MMAVMTRLGEGGGYVTLSQIRADRAVQVLVNTPSRVIAVMQDLEDTRLVRKVAMHPEPKWALGEREEG
jgi:hypothetical protein